MTTPREVRPPSRSNEPSRGEPSSHETARPAVSVVIPVYNRATLIERAVRSALDQTHPPREILVVDDGSTDGTQHVVREIARTDERVVLLSQEHGGAPAARNLGASRATGDVIAFQDSDDEWMPEFLEVLLGSHTWVGSVVFCSFERVATDGTTEVLPSAKRVRFVKYRLRRGNLISTQTAVIDRRIVEQFPFDTRLPRLQDWDLWLSMSGAASFVHVDRVLARQYLQGDSISANQDALVAGLKMILAKHWRKFLVAPITLVRHALFVRRCEKKR